jgi:hypothetical protein
MSNYDCTKSYPDPIIKLAGTEEYTTAAGTFIRYHIPVVNWRQYPDELFAAAPDLPPCGSNTNSSRTWVRIYDGDGNYVYGFCALGQAKGLQDIWFARRKGVSPPAQICVKFMDRACDKVYSSNCISTRGYDCNVVYPNPKLVFEGTEEYTTPSGTFIRYQYDVLNYKDYPDALFAAAPALPPCGSNTNSSRTWANFYDAATDQYIYGFCAFNSADDLNKVWFARKKGTAPPREVYLVLEDRGCKKKYRSNNAPTSLVDCSLTYPDPVLKFEGIEAYSTGAGDFIRYKFDVPNYADYPNDLFAAAPDLPPCGLNANSSRTWVNFYDAADDSYIYGFCAFDSADHLNKVWFAVRAGETAPKEVYLVLEDRRCKKKYTSKAISTHGVDCTTTYADPVLEYVGTEDYTTPAGDFTRYLLQVANKGDYPDSLFVPAPELPPCGANANASRTWVDIFDARNNRLYGFCALDAASQLDSLWFALRRGTTPPEKVYLKLTDRFCEKAYVSNKVDLRKKKGIVVHKGNYTVCGQLRDADGNPQGGLRVTLWDKDLYLADDGLGEDIADRSGHFEIHFNAFDYRDFFFFDRFPDLYFKVYRGDTLILNTEADLIMNAREQDDLIILVVP